MLAVSIGYLKTLKKERNELENHDFQVSSTNERIESVENMKVYQVHRAVQQIRDYKFKASFLIWIEVVTMTILCSVSTDILMIPYIIVFIIEVVIIGCSGKNGTLNKFSLVMIYLLISLILIDTTTKYIAKLITLRSS